MKVKGTIWRLSDPDEPLLFLNSKVPLCNGVGWVLGGWEVVSGGRDVLLIFKAKSNLLDQL